MPPLTKSESRHSQRRFCSKGNSVDFLIYARDIRATKVEKFSQDTTIHTELTFVNRFALLVLERVGYYSHRVRGNSFNHHQQNLLRCCPQTFYSLRLGVSFEAFRSHRRSDGFCLGVRQLVSIAQDSFRCQPTPATNHAAI